MASAESDEDNVDDEIQCAFCMEYGRYLEDPRTLPCRHSFCMPCLQNAMELKKVIECPVCGYVTQRRPESFVRADLSASSTPLWCDVCLTKSAVRQEAENYCLQCGKKFCSSHLKSHADMLSEHDVLSIADYRLKSAQYEKRVCTSHSDQEYSLCCSSCHKVYCLKCVSSLETCQVTGSEHRLLALDEFSAQIKKELVKMRSRYKEQLDSMNRTIKTHYQFLDEQDESMEQMIYTIESCYSKQVAELRSKYDTLIAEVNTKRLRCHSDVESYIEKELVTRMDELQRQQSIIKAQLENTHQVDIVGAYETLSNHALSQKNDEIPLFESNSFVQLTKKAPHREVEIGLTMLKHEVLNHRIISQRPPASLKEIESFNTSGYCTNVQHFAGVTYLGSDNGSVSILGAPTVRVRETALIELRKHVAGLDVCDSGVVVSTDGYPNRVGHYTNDGKLITAWAHTDTKGCWSSNVAIVNDRVVLVDKTGHSIRIYTMDGKVVKTIPCLAVTGRWVSICRADNESVIISVYKTSRVLKVNILSGETVWACNSIDKAQGVVCFRDKYVLVASECEGTVISILDINTGELLKILTADEDKPKTCIFSLAIKDDDTLIVPRYVEKKIYVYELRPF